jgi:hypothetical protein
MHRLHRFGFLALVVLALTGCGAVALADATANPTASPSPTASASASPNPSSSAIAAPSTPTPTVTPTPQPTLPSQPISISGVSQTVVDRIPGYLSGTSESNPSITEAVAQQVALSQLDSGGTLAWANTQSAQLAGYALANVSDVAPDTGGAIDWLFVYYSPTPMFAFWGTGGHYAVVAVNATTGQVDLGSTGLENGS